MNDPTAYRDYRRLFLTLRYEEDPTILIEELVNLARGDNGSRPARLPFPPV
jgi:processive 1,2-diacylglycerol beta-glucosyltransferase